MPCMDISKFRCLSADLGVGNSWMYVSLTSQLEKPWNFLSLSDLHALRICHYSTKSGFYHLKVFASYIKTLHSMSIFLRFSAINRLTYSLTHMNCPSNSLNTVIACEG